MFSIFRKIFDFFFRKKPPPSVEPEKAELLPSGEADRRTGVRRSREPADFQEELKTAAAEKLARRRANRAEKKLQTEKKSRASAEKQNSGMTNRHGISLLTQKDDFSEFFRNNGVEEASAKVFGDMLETSLSDENIEDALHAAKDKYVFPPRTLSISEKIKTYPPVQKEIDLHGCTVAEAEKKTGSFILTARHQGLHTVRIIVGKGIHSQGKAVLPDAVEKEIVRLKKAGEILTFRWENNSKLKSGSMFVYLP
jgi:DNA-nicking Smr family endonuclease